MAITNLSLLKPGLKTALAEALYNEILSNTNNYYYFIGKSLEWAGGIDNIEAPENTLASEAETRNDMIFFKKVTSADVAFTVPRYDWVSGQVYDMYDDRLGDQTTVAATAPSANFSYVDGTFDLSTFGVGWLVTGTGIAPNTYVDEATPTRVTLTTRTSGAVTEVTFKNVAPSGATSLDTARFYTMTADNVVYKCLDNNNGAPSTSKPYSTTSEPITTPDGYVWKYMYTIPNSLVNKFMSLDDMPVTTAVKSAYYSSGAIGSLRILDYGLGYAPGDEIIVTGDGHRRDNGYRIITITIENPGSGYSTAPTITIDPPFETVPYELDTDFLSGQYLETDDGKIYLVITAGRTDESSAPTHTSSISVINGTTSLRFVGLAATGTAVLDGDVVDNIELSGFVGYINVDNIGSGYDPEDPPEVIISGDGAGAQAYAQVSANGYISDIIITDRGTGYTAATATIAPPVSGTAATLSVEVYYGFGYGNVPAALASAPFEADVAFVPEAEVTSGDIVQSGTRFYEATSSGTLGLVPPSHASGIVASGDVDLDFIGETASLSVFTEKTNAYLRPVIENEQIVGVIIVDGGQGYTTATITTAGAGEGALIEADLALGDLNTRQANAELLAVPGSIDSIDVLHPGLAYVFANVEVTGDGEGCTAEAVLTDGAITKINVTNAGSGYTHATVTITGNGGATQAYARAIVSPPDGHGKNAIKELFAKDLSLATTIALDRNQGFVVENDYRQLGLIKNPADATTGFRSTRFTGSACFVIAGDFVYGDVDVDDILTDADDHQFQVVAKPLTAPTTGTVSLLVQAKDNIAPVVGGILTYGPNPGDVATLTSVTAPTIDKYSGDLLFIDNRASFQPTDEQTVSIKTAIRL